MGMGLQYRMANVRVAPGSVEEECSTSRWV